MKRYSSYRVLVFPNFAAIAHLEYSTKWVMSEEEPLEDIVQRFQSGGLMSAMTTLPKGVKIGTSQVRQMSRMRSQAQIVEESSLEQRKRKRRKVKVRKRQRRTTQMVERVDFPRRTHGKKKGPRNRHPRHRKTKGKRKGMKQKFSMQTKACSQNGIHVLYGFRMKGSRLNEMFEKAGRYRFIFSL